MPLLYVTVLVRQFYVLFNRNAKRELEAFPVGEARVTRQSPW